MTISVRLEPKVEQQLAEYCAATGESKSDVVKESLRLFFESRQTAVDAYSAGKELFGRHSSARADTSHNVNARFREFVRERHTAQSREFFRRAKRAG